CPSPRRAAARGTLRSVSNASNATKRLRSSLLRLAWSMLVIDIIDWNDDTKLPMFKARLNEAVSGGRHMKIAIIGIGAGNVGKTLGRVLEAKGHDIAYGTRDPAKAAVRHAKTVVQTLAGRRGGHPRHALGRLEAVVSAFADELAGKIFVD